MDPRFPKDDYKAKVPVPARHVLFARALSASPHIPIIKTKVGMGMCEADRYLDLGRGHIFLIPSGSAYDDSLSFFLLPPRPTIEERLG